MKIGSQHVYKIWRSLVEHRNCVEASQAPATAAEYLQYTMVAPAVPQSPTAAAAVAAVANISASTHDTNAYDRQLANSFSSSGAGDARATVRVKFPLKDDHDYC